MRGSATMNFEKNEMKGVLWGQHEFQIAIVLRYQQIANRPLWYTLVKYILVFVTNFNTKEDLLIRD